MVCVTVLQWGQYGEVRLFSETLCKYELGQGAMSVS